MARSMVALLALLASGCPSTPAPAIDASDGASGSDAATDAGALAAATEDATAEAGAPVPVPMLGWRHPARRVAFADPPASSRAAFLRAHGVATDKPDAACWKNGGPVCTCDRSVAVTTATGTADVLVCLRAMPPPPSAVLPGIGRRTVLYAVDKGVLKVLLDVPTHATIDPENAEGSVAGSVGLRVVASPNGVTLADEFETDEGPWCPQAIKRAAAQKGQEWPLVQRNFAAACAAAGRYVLANGRLVRGG